jgi:hypothetical protein
MWRDESQRWSAIDPTVTTPLGGAYAWHAFGYSRAGAILASFVISHYILSWDRTLWILHR